MHRLAERQWLEQRGVRFEDERAFDKHQARLSWIRKLLGDHTVTRISTDSDADAKRAATAFPESDVLTAVCDGYIILHSSDSAEEPTGRPQSIR